MYIQRKLGDLNIVKSVNGFGKQVLQALYIHMTICQLTGYQEKPVKYVQGKVVSLTNKGNNVDWYVK